LSLFSNDKILSVQDSLKIEKYKNHINTLQYISRQNYNTEFFLDLALKYVDSILQIQDDNTYASEIEETILLTKNTIDNNVISKIEFFEFYSGVPSYYGFVDDAIEYAYDDALTKLLNLKYRVLGNVPLSEAGITSILIREDCDDATFEIINQSLISNSNHRILQANELIEVLGVEKSNKLINGQLREDDVKTIINNLKLDKLGIFSIGNIDVIDNKIWLVKTDFKTYNESQGFIESIFTKGYTVDKRNLSLFFEIILILILAIIFVSLAYSFSLIFVNRKNILISSNDLNKEFFISILNKVKYVALYFFLPIILSFVMIYLCSFIIPKGDVDVGEINVLVWILSLTFLMSFLPIILNLFVVNRLDIDGFHTTLGYTFFANSCLYATYFPIFIFYFIQYETYPFLLNVLLIFITLLIGNLLGKSYFQYGFVTKNNYKRRQAITGLVLGLIALIIFNRIIIYELSIQNLLLSFAIIAPISILNEILDNYSARLFEKKSKDSKETLILDKVKYVESVMNPGKLIYETIENQMSDDDLDIMLINAPMGMGKTRSLNEARFKYFTEENGWKVCRGDCDEIQDETAISFEPFLEAFSDILGETWNSRSETTDKITKGFMDAASDRVGIPLGISEYSSSSKKTMNEISLEIMDKLTSSNKKVLFIMEDIHWIDPETLTLLKHFIKTVNRNTFLRQNLCIVITVRSDIKPPYRGLNYEELKTELVNLDDKTTNPFELHDLLDINSFKLVDFVKNLSIENNEFRIASSSMNQINTLFNEYNEQLKSESENAKLTPLYVFKVLESWISDGSLKYSPDGYLLTKTVDLESLPPDEDIDSYYHSIFDTFDPKWRRILESASVIGNKFDADILAQVWGYKLLDVLDFLENAVNNDLLIDVSSQDNFYEFKDRRIVSALKSYFKDASMNDEGEKQIIIEYNKRYLELQLDIIKNPEKHDTENLLKVIRRMLTLSSIEYYRQNCNKLILDVVCRYLYFKKLGKLDAFANLLEKKNYNELADLVKKLKIIADDVNFSFAEKQKILDELAEEENRKSKIPLPAGINPDQLSNDLRLLIILNGEIMNTFSESIVTTTTIGFKHENFKSFIPTLNKFPTKLNGLSLIYFIKYLGNINLDLDDEVEMIISGEYEKKQKEIEQGQKVMFESAVEQLQSTKFHKLAVREQKLWEIEKASRNIGESKEKIDEIFNKYKSLIESLKNQNPKFLYDCINSYLSYCHSNYRDGKKSTEVFKLYNQRLKNDDKINEAWVLTFIKFILSKCNGSTLIRPGKMYIDQNPEIAKQNFDDAKKFLAKILDKGSVNKASMWFIDAEKLYCLLKKDFIGYKNLQLDYLNRLKIDFSEESTEFDKASVNIANDLEWHTEHSPNCPDFFNDCIVIWKKALNYSLSQNKDYEEFDKKTEQLLRSVSGVTYSQLAHRYQKISSLYLKKNSLKNALNYNSKALDLHKKIFEDRSPVNWDFIDGELIPLSKDTKELFPESETDTVVGYGRSILNYAKCLSMQKKYDEAIKMIDKASNYFYIFPKIYNLSQLEKGINLVYNKSSNGPKLIKESIKNLEKLDKKFSKTEIDLIAKAKKLIS
tara:strand:+ start:576 stop:5318 length:4743 start_codon:yes stop_codon:yes gene_type:complete